LADLRKQADMPRVRFVGAAHPNWGGTNVTIEAKHQRIRTVRGKPDSCIWGCTDVQIYEWANLTGDYDDIWDYAAMCRSCHRRYDNARRSMEPGFTRHPGGARGRLSADQVRELRARAAKGISRINLAEEYGISLGHVHDVIRGAQYAWVQE